MKRRGITLGLAVLGGLALSLTATPALGKTKTVQKTFSSGTLATPILDDRLIVQGVRVPKKERGTVTDVDALVRINHTADSDVFIALVSPNAGRFANLTTDNGGSGDNFGTGSNDCSGTPTEFNDSAATAITGLGTPAAPFAGSFRPQDPLSIFNGLFTTPSKKSAGIWSFIIGDDAAPDTGILGCVQVRIAYTIPVKKKKKKT
jgi:subtilisin-like proprotein convertase family protein